MVIEPFFNNPKNWHFDELVRDSGISRPQLANWLKKLEKNGMIKRFKEKGKMPYYRGIDESITFQNRKKMFALQKLVESNFLDSLRSIERAKVVIIFGSYSRNDWYEDSDVDVFVYGGVNSETLKDIQFGFDRNVQFHIAKNKRDLRRMMRILPYIVSGHFIKGSFLDLELSLNAKV